MKKYLLLISFIITSLTVFAQGIQLKGVVADSTGTPIPGALISLQSANQKLSMSTDVNGFFLFPGVQDSTVNIIVQSMGYDHLQQSFSVDRKLTVNDIGTVRLHSANSVLDEVMVTAMIPVILKEDTVQYDARAYQVREGDAVEEMVKKLPGIDVDNDGNITANGEPITSIRLDGKEYFGDDVAGAIQNLPADIVKNLQVIDDYGEQANETGLKSGTPEKVLNINLQDDKKRGYFARGAAGLGTENRYNSRLRGNYLNGEQQLSLDAQASNNRGRSSGVNDRKSVKGNYRDNWNKKLESYGNYRFDVNDNDSWVNTSSETFFPDYTRYEVKESSRRSKSKSHRFSWNFEYRPDTSNYIKIEPDIRYETNRGTNTESSQIQLNNATSHRETRGGSADRSMDLGLEVFYNHKFRKPRRNLTLEMEINSATGQGDRHVQNDYLDTDEEGNSAAEQQYQDTYNREGNLRSQARASYFEPLSSVSFLELAYRWNRTSNDILKETFDIDPADGDETLNKNLSNDYDYHFTTNRFGLNYRLKNEKINSTIGLFAQPSTLSGFDFTRDIETFHQHFNWVPSLRFAYQFSREKQLVLDYDGNTNQPSFQQLQPVTDNSNLQSVITGNPNLKPEFSHRGKVEYRQTDTHLGSSLYGRISIEQVNDKIVTSKNIADDEVKQEISYTNVNGSYNATGDYSVTVPLSERKFVVSYYGGSNYSNNISLTNDERIVGKNLGVRQGVKFRVDLEDIVDTELNTSYSHNNAKFSTASMDDRSSSQFNISLEGRNYFFEDFTLGYDLTKRFNRGYNAGIGDPTFLSVYLEHRFLKNNQAEIRLQGFDIFGQNTGIQRDIFDNEIVDTRSNRLSTYFMLSFNYRLQNFGG
ncbi:outer membrane beta-barrel protein [Sphingobacterium arenae]|uniref:Outer membrane beta-barrel protein n=1 Tax=Sphingobacterium arenae TaxID=1280598 RepID=A0ABR7XZX8_9SPHI|nr:outer membrane beta-barrel protein [Sphingobacterium arenae]MBD1424602.1 outer membrane beta-barrel protein [Sphingobacterium arenae]